MKRLVSVFLILALCLSLTGTVFAASEAFVLDEEDLLTDTEEARLTETLRRISQTHNAQVAVVTRTAFGADADYLVEEVYDSLGFGYGDRHDGVLLLVCMDVRQYRILSNGFAADAITPGRIDAIGDAIVSDLSDGDYADAFQEFAEQCDYYLNGHRNGFPFPLGQNLVIALVIGVLAGLITALVLKSQLRSVRQQHQADVYMKPGSMKLTACHDLYLYRNVTRRKRESSSGSSRSGSSRNVGGGSF